MRTWTVVLTLLLAGCLAPDVSWRAPPGGLSSLPAATPGADEGGKACGAALQKDGFMLCDTVFSGLDGSFTVGAVNRSVPMHWSDLRLRSASAHIRAFGTTGMDVQGDLDLGQVRPGPIQEGDTLQVCRTFDGTGPAMLTFWDARPFGATVHAKFKIAPCVGAAAPPNATGAAPRTRVSFTQDYGVVVSQVLLGGGTFSVNNQNCLDLPTTVTPWSGNITAEWQAPSPAGQQLVLGMEGQGGAVTGPSPLRLAFNDIRDASMVGVSPSTPGTALQQNVKLTLSLTITGDPADVTGGSGCTIA